MGTKVIRRIVVLFALIVPLGLWAAMDYPAGTEWVPGRLLVNFSPSVGVIQTQERVNGRLSLDNEVVDAALDRFQVSGIYRIVPDGVLSKMPVAPDQARLVAINFPESWDVLEVRDAFLAMKEVVDAEPDLLFHKFDRLPNDEQWNQQCDKRTMGCPTAWDFGTGTEALLAVAVDGGFWWSHHDAYDNLWVNPGEDLNNDGLPYSFNDYPGDIEDLNGSDDDGNGYPDDMIGWDFIDNIGGCAGGEDCDEQDNDTKSIGNHGTHVLGLAGAQGNNSIGVTGVCWNLKIMASRAGYVPAGGEGLIVTSAAIATINWSVAHGVDLINMSYGGGGFSNQVNNTIQAAWASGALLCAASGNDGVNQIQYPCGYENVICVGATDCNDIVADFSNYGAHVDCFAPGVDVRSLSTGDDSYTNLQGTSMASPNAMGIFALVWSIFPDLNNGQIRDLVLQNAVDLHSLNPTYGPNDLGTGRVDAADALAMLLPNLNVVSTAITGDADNDARLESGETAQLVFNVSNEAGWFDANNVQVAVTTSDPNLTLNNATYTIGSLANGQAQEMTSPSATITCGNTIPYAYTASLQVDFLLDGNVHLVRSATLRIGRAATLVVDDDNGGIFGAFYSSALTAGGFNFDDYSVMTNGAVSSTELLHYDNVIWACGNQQANTLTQSDRDNLQGFLISGGNLLLAGQGIDEDTEVTGSSFYADYLHTQSGAAAGSTQLTGVTGDPISEGANLLLVGGGCGGNGAVSPSVLNATNGGTAFYTYNSNGLGGAVRFSNETYRTAYFGFALEAACGAAGSTHHREVVRRVMTWFGATADAGEEPNAIPVDFSVSPAYPNPFNPESSVRIELAHAARVRATLHDVLGRQVELIADRPVSAGVHTIQINGNDLPSGSYWLNVSIDGMSDVQRIVLLK